MSPSCICVLVFLSQFSLISSCVKEAHSGVNVVEIHHPIAFKHSMDHLLTQEIELSHV